MPARLKKQIITLLTVAVASIQELQLTAWLPPPPPPFLQSLSVLLPICHVVLPGTERIGKEAGVKVRDWEIQLGGKRMKREEKLSAPKAEVLTSGGSCSKGSLLTVI